MPASTGYRRPVPPPPTYGMWLIARTPVDRPYPCRCWLGKPCNTSHPHPAYRCPCWGRADTGRLPAHCCTHRHPLNAPQAGAR